MLRCLLGPRSTASVKSKVFQGQPCRGSGREPCPGGSPGPSGMPLTSTHRGCQFLPSPTPGCDNLGYLQILLGAPCGDTVTLKVRATGLSYRREQIQSQYQNLGMGVSEQTTARLLTTLDFSFYDSCGPYLHQDFTLQNNIWCIKSYIWLHIFLP